MHARAAARFVHTASRFRARVTVRRDDRIMDGKSILGILLLAAGAGHPARAGGGRRRRGGGDRRPGLAGGERLRGGSVERGAHGHRRVAGHRRRPGARRGARGRPSSGCAWRRTRSRRRPTAPAGGAASASSSRPSRSGWRATWGAPRLHLRRPPADAGGPAASDRALAVIREDHVNAEWALRTVAEQLHALFAQFTDAYLRERSTDLDDVLGRVQLNLGGAGDAPSLARLPGSFVLVAAGLDAVRDRPSWTGSACWPWPPTRARPRTTRRSWRARSACRPWSACATRRGASRRARWWWWTAPAARWWWSPRRPPSRASARPRSGTGRGGAPAGACARCRRSRATACASCCGRTSSSRTTPRRRRSTARRASGSSAPSTCWAAPGSGRPRSGSWRSTCSSCGASRRTPSPCAPGTSGLEDLAPGGPTSANPALGERALRLLPRAPTRSARQLRALLRAAAHGPLRILLPFVTGPSDLRLALDLIAEARESCAAEGVEHAAARPGRREPRGARARPSPPTCWPARSTSSRSAPTTSCSTCWPPTAATRASRRTTSRCTRRCCACCARWWRRRSRRRARVRLRRDGGGRAAGAAPRGPGRARALHEPRGHPAREGRRPRGPGRATWRRSRGGCLDLPTARGDRSDCCVARWPRCWRRSRAF